MDDCASVEGRPHRAGTCSVAMHGRPEYRVLKGDRVGGGGGGGGGLAMV